MLFFDLFFLKYEMGEIDLPQKKLSLKSPELLGVKNVYDTTTLTLCFQIKLGCHYFSITGSYYKIPYLQAL